MSGEHAAIARARTFNSAVETGHRLAADFPASARRNG